ncbi:hydroxylase [Dietzia kunjamensis]|uniref:acyl-CoA dehydrogenase family protein n=1 Tax=Dietzia TaxID=37914 RepID=UPI0023300240|nr:MULTISPECIES: acyl-CoA dehydrogenase family protein [Dietzia]MEB8325505.1 hydroxylase [Dietzia kunjamensis]
MTGTLLSADTVLPAVTADRDALFAEGLEADELGQLPAATVSRMKAAGVIRMLQPAKYGGMEATPRQFAETVMGIASINPSAGWVAGIVGVHPWQLAMAETSVQDDVWGTDPDTWIASPYMPNGMAVPVEGGYRMSGRWSFSSGTDHCTWAFLGAMACEADGSVSMPPRMLHVVLPRTDYEIIADSWDVVGLKGTGSKDLVVEDAFIPAERVMEYDHLIDGSQVARAGLEQTVYRMPWSCMFPLGITSATVGISEGLLATAREYLEERIGAQGTAIKDDPYVLYQLGESEAKIYQARQSLIANAEEIWDIVDRGDEVSFTRRAQGRRTQAEAAWTAVRAVDNIYARCGGTALRMDKPMQRFWRDAHAGLHHAIHVPSTVFHASALASLGVDPEGPLRAMI